jgi:acetyl-CoA carboxylase biotin carboxyl carrier protein
MASSMNKAAATSDVSGTVWQVLVAVGDTVSEYQELILVESMKMEIPVLAPRAGTVSEILVKETDAVAAEQIVAWIE